MGEVLALLALVFFGGSKKKAASSSTPDDSKLPDNGGTTPPPPSSPSWSGRIGAMQFTVTRGTGAWVCKINGAPSNHATAFLALRNALLVSSANAAKTAGLFLIAEPFVFEANATRMPGVVELWRWHVRVPEAGTTILDGANDAMAEGTEPNRNDALGVIASWARPYTEGQTAHG